MPRAIKATIFIPVYNGEDYLRDALRMIFRQKADFAYEVFIIDSGSTDTSLDIIKEYQKRHDNLRLEQIPNSEFGHGKTRNLAAKKAKGEFIVYLSQDAIPAHNEWLVEMLAPFEIHDKVVAVFGKQDPRRKCFPLMKYDIQRVFSDAGPAYAGISLFYDGNFLKDEGARDLATFYSDVNSATRREFLLNTIPYRDVPYSEDQLFGQDVIRAGYYKVYTPRGNVVHSNDLTLRKYRHRMYDEIIGLRKIGRKVPKPGVIGLVKGIMRDEVRILMDSQYGRKRKLFWLVVNPLYHIQRWRGIRLGVRAKLEDPGQHAKYSLEAMAKNARVRTKS